MTASFQSDNPFARDAAKNRKKAAIVVAVAVALVATIFAVRWFRSPDRVMDKNRAFLEGLRAKYCKVLDNEKKTEPSARTPARGVDHATVLGFYAFDGFSMPEKDGNLDKVQFQHLESICGGGETKGDDHVRSVFGGVVETRPYMRDRYTQQGLREAIAALEHAEYLLVVRVDQMTASTAVGEKGLAPGRFKGRAALWRLSDGAFIDGVDVAAEASSVEYVEKGHEDLQLAVKTDEALERAIARRFADRGIAMKLEHDWSQH